MQIPSTSNPRVKAAARLRDRQGRNDQGRIIIDGVREIGLALSSGIEIAELYFFPELCRDEAHEALLASARTAGTSLIEVTPPVQDYPSTHSALGDAAAEVLSSVFGDRTAFTVGSTTAPREGYTRSFASFTAAADENADSRVRAGLHFRFSCEEGQRLGRKIGRYAVETQLRPL